MQLIATNKAPPGSKPFEIGNRKNNEQIPKAPPQRELLILWTLRGTGASGIYGLDIQRAIEECSGGAESISHGSLYSLLKRLRRKGYIDSYEGDAIGGGAKRHYYFLTESGLATVNAIDKLYRDLKEWNPE